MSLFRYKWSEERFGLVVLPFVLMIVSLVVDMVNGFLQNTCHLTTPVGVCFRGLLIALTLKYPLRLASEAFGRIAVAAFFLFLLALPVWMILEPYSDAYADVIYFSRILFYYCIASYFWYYRDRFDIAYLSRLTSRGAFISALSLVFCYATGMGKATYTIGEISVGTRGFFTAGNDVGLYMNMGLVASLVHLVFSPTLRQAFVAFTVFVGGLLIGSRVGLFGNFLIVALFLGYFMTRGIPEVRLRRIYVLLARAGLIAAVFFVMQTTLTFVRENDYLYERLTSDNAVNPRRELMAGGEASIRNLNGHQLLVGRGLTGSNRYVARAVRFPDDEKAVEADLHDTLSSYGYLLGSLVILSFLLPLLRGVRMCAERLTYPRYMNLIALCLFWGIGCMAGHAFANVMVFPIMSAVFIVALKYDSRQ
ncbi:O-antigen ligase family protein [uncultured Alistipes sp.]|uniref:O-antigen ligase family protein n=1 Tax=uncultured Alistipes sp. TaxID=538949 RepID=UPI002602D596|nr:O-antigen ligase family protein [uncultured Alistipes sp.]